MQGIKLELSSSSRIAFQKYNRFGGVAQRKKTIFANLKSKMTSGKQIFTKMEVNEIAEEA